MTVQELIEQLKQFEPGAEVHFQYNYGDHWRTQVAPAVSEVEEGVVQHSSYHNMPVMVDEDDDEERPEQKTVVVIS